MSIEKQLQDELLLKAKQRVCPPELKEQARRSYRQFLKEERRKPMKKKLVATAAAVLMLIPTFGVAAASGILGDEIHGSYEQAKKSVIGFTKEKYMEFGLKLSGAKAVLGEDEYARFIELRKQYVRFFNEHAEANGHVDVDKLSPADRAALKQLMAEMVPQDDKLNHNKQTVEVLTPEEFDQYLEASLTSQTVLAQSGLPDQGPIDPDGLSPELKERYLASEQVLRAVSDKIHVLDQYEQTQFDALGEADYLKFRELQRKQTDIRYRYTQGKPSLDYSKLPADKRAKLKSYLGEEQTYVERIRHLKLSQDVLTPAERDTYLEALITEESIQARYTTYDKKGVHFEPEKLPAGERQQWEQAQQTIQAVQDRLK